jgi:hypothetical protein
MLKSGVTFFRKLVVGFFLSFFLPAQAPAQGSKFDLPILKAELTSDLEYTANNVFYDLRDIATAPSRVSEIPSIVLNPKFFLFVGGAGVAFGGSYALDTTMRAQLRGMSERDQDIIEAIATAGPSVASGLLYLYGIYVDDPRAREYMITAGEAVGLTDLLAVVTEFSFRRLGPNQSGRHSAFFQNGGQSFVEGETAPLFALAAGIGSYYHDRWYVDVPVYSLAALEAIDRMGEDKHWFSDVVMGALLGVASAKLLLYMHEHRDLNDWRFKFSSATSSAQPSGSLPIGASVALDW